MSEKNALDKFASNLNSSSITFTYTWYVLFGSCAINEHISYNVSKLEVKTKSVSYINYIGLTKYLIAFSLCNKNKKGRRLLSQISKTLMF